MAKFMDVHGRFAGVTEDRPREGVSRLAAGPAELSRWCGGRLRAQRPGSGREPGGLTRDGVVVGARLDQLGRAESGVAELTVGRPGRGEGLLSRRPGAVLPLRD
jgi:hypothetical protein